MSSISSDPSAASQKFLRKHPAWIRWVRRPVVIAIYFLVLVIYAVFLLPHKETPPWQAYLSLGVFVILVLAWSGNILSDRDKSEFLKGIVAFGLIGILGWLFYQFSGAHWGNLQSSFFDMKRMMGNWGYLLSGLLVNFEVALMAVVFTIIIGLLVAILRFEGDLALNNFLVAYVDLFRSIPMLVLMVILFFALPYVGISMGSITTTVVALSIGYGAYASECFRSGFESVHSGQIEAARSLGLSRWQTLRMVVLPQSIPVVIPSLTGILISMIKDTSLASLVACPEVLYHAQELYASEASPTPLVAAAFIYVIVLIPLVRISNILENRMAKEK
jgi:polar amino acid transport system permease protein